MRSIELLLVLLAFCASIAAAEPTKLSASVTEFGAKGDGVTIDTNAIQQAIDSVSSKGGGLVHFPAGKYLTGTVQLKSGTHLDLDKNAILLGSTNEEDYPPMGDLRDGLGTRINKVLVCAIKARDIGIQGAGTIDGQGQLLQKAKTRPFLVRFQECQSVEVSGVTLMNSAMWTCHLWDSGNVDIHGVTIRKTPGARNNDGIDIDASHDVTIRDCNIESGDDAICFKATINKPCRNITVTGCSMDTHWNGFKIGTESVGDFEDITMKDCVFENNTKGGIRIYSVDGANIRRIRVENITLRSVDLPVYIRLGSRLHVFRGGDSPRPVGSISDVVLSNIHGKTHGTGVIFITGIPGHRVSGVRIDNIDCTTPGGGAGKPDAPLAEKESAYPEPYSIFGPLPAYGIVLRHAENISISKAKVTCDKPDPRHAVACIYVSRVSIVSTVFANPAANPAKNLFVHGCADDAITWDGRVTVPDQPEK